MKDIRKHDISLVSELLRSGTILLNSKSPPVLGMGRNLPHNPKEKGDVCQNRDNQSQPKPKIFAPDAPVHVVIAYPAPILLRFCHRSVSAKRPENDPKTLAHRNGCYVAALVNSMAQNNYESHKKPYCQNEKFRH